jgi:uncharacterized protein (TIGR02246 family)
MIGDNPKQKNIRRKIQMLKNRVVLFIVLTVAAAGGARAQQTDAKSGDDAMLRQAVTQMMTGWNAKSGEQFAAPFAADADYVVINGMKLKTRRAIAEGHQQIFDTFYKVSTLSLAVDTIRYLKPDVAIIHANASLKFGGRPDENLARMTLVMTKNSGRWEIAAFQNTAIQPTGGN